MTKIDNSNLSGKKDSGTDSDTSQNTEEQNPETKMEENEVKRNDQVEELIDPTSVNSEPLTDVSDEPQVQEAAAVENKNEPVMADTPAVTEKQNEVTEVTNEVEKPAEITDQKTKDSGNKDHESSDHEGSDHEDTEHEEPDYSHFSKKELVDEIKTLAHEDDVLKADKKSQQLLPFFEEIHNKEKEDALKKFIGDGGEADGFEYRNDELDDRFEANFQLIHDRKVKFLKEKERERESNLKRKEEVLEKLRHFVDSEETNISFNQFKEIQDEWKAIGSIPSNNAKTLWANYHALIDRFYDNRSIYFELKELDRKKNLDLKLELCEKAEKLIGIENLKDAITELNELHNEFKHLGPVPQEEQETIWNRFKGASDTIYQRRKVFVEELKKNLEVNFEQKAVLSEQAKTFVSFDSDRIKEWNSKTTEILELQKEWDKIGGLPRNKAKEVNKAFWGSFKTFFSNKNQFFKKLDSQREGNLKLKEDLIKKVDEIKDSEDFEGTANQIKELQKQWKETGPVPEKQREKIYKTFKAACDYFFDRKRSQQADSEKEYEKNLEIKEDICKSIEDLAGSDDADHETLRELQKEFFKIGFVPKRAIRKIKKRFDSAVENFINQIEGITEEEKETLLIREEIDRLKSAPGSENRLARKEQEIRRNIQHLENDMSLWKNNLEF
ncbi:MAG: DUF349 domain-containing protein, partial [Cyclobacteriaceae bacterium]|nr:DUF349 domain-containing protein [Cyclobacteriaceae bacterium]